MVQQLYQHFAEIWAKCDLLAILGLIGQFIFAGRFVVQWIASERRKQSVIPVVFWHMSIVGSVLLLVYGFLRADPIFILGYLFNSFVYVRNLMFIYARDPSRA